MQHIFFYDQSSGTSALMLADANLDAWNPASLTTSLPPSPLSFDSVTGYAPRGPLTMDGLPGQFLGLSEDARLVVLHSGLPGGGFVSVRGRFTVGEIVSDPTQGQAAMKEAYWAFVFSDGPNTKVVRLKVTIRSVEVLRPDPPESARSYSSVANNDAVGTFHARSMLDSPQAWSVNGKALNDPHWMKIDLGLSQMVAGVIVRGRHISLHAEQFAHRMILFVIHEDGTETNMGTYNTNLTADGRRREIVFTNGPILARSVRIQTDGCNSHCSMRAGILVPSAGKAYVHATNAFYNYKYTLASTVGIDIAELFASKNGTVPVATSMYESGYGVHNISWTTVSTPPT